MTLSTGDTLTKADGEAYSVQSETAQDATHFSASLLWTNPPTTNEQQPFHVFSADGACSKLPTVNGITQWPATPVADGPFRLVFYAYSPSDGSLLSIDFTCDTGKPHTTTQKVTQAGKVIQTQTIVFTDDLSTNSTSLQHPIMPGEFVDFYSDGDSGQMFWYAPGAASQNTSYNLEGFVGDPKFTDVALTIEPLIADTPLTFSVLKVNVESLGQISNNIANGLPIKVQFIQEPTVPTCGVPLTVPNTNVCMMDAALQPNNNALPGFVVGTPTNIVFKMSNI